MCIRDRLGWDEAFVGLRCADPEAAARGAQEAVYDAARSRCSVGIGDTLVRAKMATCLLYTSRCV